MEHGHFPGPGDLVDPKKFVLEITPGTSGTWHLVLRLFWVEGLTQAATAYLSTVTRL